MHGLKISPATIFDLTRRAAEAVQSEYDAILNKIRNAPILYVDETGIHVQEKSIGSGRLPHHLRPFL